MAGLFSLEGKVAIVTGGSKGIGEGIARELALAGADLVIAARGRERLEQTAAALAGLGSGGLLAVEADVTKEADRQKLVDATVNRFGRLDVLINNAGGSGPGNTGWAMDMTEEQWDHVADLNVKACMFMSQAAAKAMRTERYGKIVNIASIAGTFPSPRLSNYGAAKAGMLMLTRTLAWEWARFGIRVNAIIPGIVWSAEMEARSITTAEALETEIEETPLGRLGRPRDIGAACVYFAAESGDWVTGTSITIDGGLTVPTSVRRTLINRAIKKVAPDYAGLPKFSV
jgi:NAD(P)-dependent dehydrogenase (short-subunit alcohol dehydrogenase family)